MVKRMMSRWITTFLVLLWLLGAWADLAFGREYKECGIASFYWAHPRERWGHKTACLNYFDPSELTAAHPSLKCGTKVRVTDPVSKQSIDVVISDRGPARRLKRIIDLTPAGARLLGFESRGLLRVCIEVIEQ